MKNLSDQNVKIKDGFWRFYMDLNKTAIIKSVYERFKETGRFDALRCEIKEGRPISWQRMPWDSDVVKWIEGAAYVMAESGDTYWEPIIDEMIDNIAKNQREDGYFNSFFLTEERNKIFKDRTGHELYSLGHMIEAAIAYHKVTGKDKLLNCALKYIDLVYKVFVLEQSAPFVTPGHEEIELALLKLYDYLGNDKHLQLARFFIDKRANNDKEEKDIQRQDNVPVRQITEAVGHSVRAGYLYTAMRMLATVDDDDELKLACERVFNDIVNHKMSITGSIGSEHSGEKFSYKYDLPNSDTYNETCAAISLMLFAGAMQEAKADSCYADIIERVLYNGFISGVSLDGEKFFYTNPLEIDRKKYARSTYQPICERVRVFDCSCCPPNVVRTLASVSRYMYTQDNNTIYCNQFASSVAQFEIDGKASVLKQTTKYPDDGKITFEYSGEPITLCVRIPDWCIEYDGKTDNGYAKFSLKNGDSITVDLPMEIHFIEANPYVQDNSGRFAVQRGPIVYCMEEIDNGENLRDVRLVECSDNKVVNEEGIPAPIIYIDAKRRAATKSLYSLKNDDFIDFKARLIPYFAFANRRASDMIVWTMVQ